jgi:RimJ/RimL family protein N-acetyltransferase
VGAGSALVEVRRRLDVTALDEAALDGMLRDGWGKAAGYSLVRWRDRTPEEHVADVAYLDGRLLQDAPMGDLAWEPEKVDAARVRGYEEARAARGQRTYNVAARHDGSGRLVAWTAISYDATSPWHAWQQITIVDPDHRGHRLGAIVKVENLRYALATEPATTAIDTWNAAVNDHMISINEAMGFRAQDRWHDLQLTL